MVALSLKLGPGPIGAIWTCAAVTDSSVRLFGVGRMVTIGGVGVVTLSGMRLVEGGGERVTWLAGASRLLPRVAAYAVVGLGLTYLVVGLRVVTS